ncbi:MAG: hypothetical protein QOC66_916 [Pseudonocardiales bacterium]|jgi:hypothetical protein|nr:hypothetical protein [Pseudonocardiales bacterium]
MIFPTISKPRRTLALSAAVLAVTFTLAACSNSSSAGSSSSSPAAGTSAGSGAAPQAGRPGASGQVAAISGATMQVQSQQAGQVAVSWTSSTTFTHPVTTTLAAVKAGDCVVATAPSGSSGTSFTATALTVSAPVNGQCGGGPGGGAGGPGNGQRPSGQRPSGFPSGGAGRGAAGGAFATGTVSSVSGSTVVIAARQPGSNGSTTNRNVTLNSQTKISTQQSTTSQSVKVGLCVSAQGTADSTGTVTASSVRITDPVNGQCTVGFGGGNNGG